MPASCRWKPRQKRSLKWIANLSFLLLSSFCSAQVIVPGELHEERFPVFNADSIRAKGITRITLRNTSKPSSRPIYDHGRRSVYEFDSEGRLSHLMLVFPLRGGRLDSVEHYWIFRSGKLVSELESTGSYKRRTRYDYSDEDVAVRKIEVQHHSEEWQSVGEEELKTIESGRQTIHSIASVGNEPFEEEITLKNSEGQIATQEVWNGPRLQARETWSYQDSTITYTYFDANATIPALLISYESEAGRFERGRWCKRAKCQDWSLYYNDRGMPKAWLFIDPVTQDMEIWEFQYEVSR